MARKTLETKNGSRIRVGEGVELPWGVPENRKQGIVIEDRGPLDIDGGQVIRIRYFEDYAGDGTPEPVETETAAKAVRIIRFYEFDATAGDQALLRVKEFVNEDIVTARVIPAQSRERFALWQPGQSISWFRVSDRIVATPESPEGQLVIPKTGRWVAQAIAKSTFVLVHRDATGREHELQAVPLTQFFGSMPAAKPNLP